MTRNPSRDAQRGAAENAHRRADERLDEALKATFPASDALALVLDEDPNSRATFASPPCFMHELDPAYLGLEPEPEHDRPDPAGGAQDEASGDTVGRGSWPRATSS